MIPHHRTRIGRLFQIEHGTSIALSFLKTGFSKFAIPYNLSNDNPQKDNFHKSIFSIDNAIIFDRGDYSREDNAFVKTNENKEGRVRNDPALFFANYLVVPRGFEPLLPT